MTNAELRNLRRMAFTYPGRTFAAVVESLHGCPIRVALTVGTGHGEPNDVTLSVRYLEPHPEPAETDTRLLARRLLGRAPTEFHVGAVCQAIWETQVAHV